MVGVGVMEEEAKGAGVEEKMKKGKRKGNLRERLYLRLLRTNYGRNILVIK